MAPYLLQKILISTVNSPQVPVLYLPPSWLLTCLDLDTDMLTGFLINLEFAVPIEDPEVLRLIDQHRTGAGESVSPDEKYLFCPPSSG